MGSVPSPAPAIATLFGIPRAQAQAALHVLDDTRDTTNTFPLPMHLAPLGKIATGTWRQESAMLRRAGVLDTDTDDVAADRVVAFLEEVRPTVMSSTLSTYAEASSNALYNRNARGPWSSRLLKIMARAVKGHVPTPMPAPVKLQLTWAECTLPVQCCLTIFRYAPVALRWGDLDGVRAHHMVQAVPPLKPGVVVRVARQKVRGRVTDVHIPDRDPMCSIIWNRRHSSSRPFRVSHRVAGHDIKRYQVQQGWQGNHTSTAWMHYKFNLELDPDLCEEQDPRSPLDRLMPQPPAPSSPTSPTTPPSPATPPSRGLVNRAVPTRVRQAWGDAPPPQLSPSRSPSPEPDTETP